MAINKARELRREEIFEAAVNCFNKNGYHDTSIDDIASAAGISKGGIYHHFKSKKDLFIDLFHMKINSYYKRVTAHIQDKEDVAARLQYMVTQSEEIFDENREILKFCLEFFAMGTRDPEIRKEVTIFYKNTVKAISWMIKEGTDAGSLKKLDSQGVARAFFFLSMGFFLISFSTNPDFNPVEQHDINMKAIFKGILK